MLNFGCFLIFDYYYMYVVKNIHTKNSKTVIVLSWFSVSGEMERAVPYNPDLDSYTYTNEDLYGNADPAL